MGTYIQSSTATSWVGTGTAGVDPEVQRKLLTSTGSAVIETATVPGGASMFTNFAFAFAVDENPTSGTYQGSYGAQLDVTTADSSLTYQIRWHNGNSDGTSVSTPVMDQVEAAFSGTGLKVASGSTTSTTALSGRRLVTFVRAANSNMMSAFPLSLRVNTADSYVTVPWDVGAPSGQDESGGAASSVHITGSGAGTAVESADGGTPATVHISAEGAGSADQPGEQHETGGTVATVNVTADASGTATEHATGAATATVHIVAQGAGQTDEAPTLQVTILSPTSAQLVWA